MGVMLASGLGREPWLLALAPHLSLLLSLCKPRGKRRLCFHLFLQKCESCLLVLSL